MGSPELRPRIVRRRLARRGVLGLIGGTTAGLLLGCENNQPGSSASKPGTDPAPTEASNDDAGGDTSTGWTETRVVDEILESSAETPEPLDGDVYGAQANGAPNLWEVDTKNGGVKKYVEAFVGQLNDWMNSAAVPDDWKETPGQASDLITLLTDNDARAIEAIFGADNRRGYYNPRHSSTETEKDIELFKALHGFVIGQRIGALYKGGEPFRLKITLGAFEEVNVLGVKGGVYQLSFDSNSPQQLEELLTSFADSYQVDLSNPRGVGGAVRERDGDGSGTSPNTVYTTVLTSEEHLKETKKLSAEGEE